jgi:hypothetical protein
LTKIAPYKVLGRLHDDPSTRADGRRPKSAKARNRGRRIAAGASGLWGISLEGHGHDGRFWVEQLAGPTGGRVGGGVWRAGKRVEPLVCGCIGGGVKGDKGSGIAVGR